ncbi:MAG: hypothetical protein ACK54P_11600 [Bacteroidota bacterium]
MNKKKSHDKESLMPASISGMPVTPRPRLAFQHIKEDDMKENK